MLVSESTEKEVDHNMALIERNREWAYKKLEAVRPNLRANLELDERVSVLIKNNYVMFSRTPASCRLYTGHSFPLEYEIEEREFEEKFHFLLEHFMVKKERINKKDFRFN